MKKILLLTCFTIATLVLFSQIQNQKVLYIIDSIQIIQEPEPGDDLKEEDVSVVTVLKNKDSLKALGLEKYDGVIYIFTKEYRNRPDELKKIPSIRQMVQKNDLLYYNDNPYTGRFIDYYLSGRKRSEGTMQGGRLEGTYSMYHQNGRAMLHRAYKNGIEHGSEKEYYEDGTLKQQGEFVNGMEEGKWEMYFPNGKIKQSNMFKAGNMEGTSMIYYSTGKLVAVEEIKDGKTIPDKRLHNTRQLIKKGHQSYDQGDMKSALKHYSKAIESDTTYAEAWANRGTAYMNDMKFDQAIADLDKALQLEPYLEKALTNRAFARIRKHQFAGNRKLGGDVGVTILAGKDNGPIADSELTLICNDLQKAILLGDNGPLIMEAYNKHCVAKKK